MFAKIFPKSPLVGRVIIGHFLTIFFCPFLLLRMRINFKMRELIENDYENQNQIAQ